MAKLKNILSEIFEDTPKVDKHQVIEGVSKYGAVGKAIYGENNLVKIAEEEWKVDKTGQRKSAKAEVEFIKWMKKWTSELVPEEQKVLSTDFNLF